MKKALIALVAALLVVPFIAGASYYPSYNSKAGYYPSPSHYGGWCYWNCGMDYGYGGSDYHRSYDDDVRMYNGYNSYYPSGGYYGGNSAYSIPTVTVYGPTWGWGW